MCSSFSKKKIYIYNEEACLVQEVKDAANV